MSSRTIIIASHRRSGTHWTIDAIRSNFPEVEKRFLSVDRLQPWHHRPMSIREFEASLQAAKRTVLVKTHTPSSLVPFREETETFRFVQELFERSDIVYVYRDGRDTLVSLYHYMRRYNPNVTDVSFSEFMRMHHNPDGATSAEATVNRVQYWASHVKGWFTGPSSHNVSYEDLHRDYTGTVGRLASYLAMTPTKRTVQIRFPKDKPLSTLAARTQRVLRRSGTSSAVLPRSGTTGAWRRYFTEEDLAFFFQYAGDVFEEIGYQAAQDSFTQPETV